MTRRSSRGRGWLSLPMCPTSAPINADRSRLCCSPGPARCSLRPSRARRAYARRPGRGDRLPPERAAALAPPLVEALDHPDHRSLHAWLDLSADVHRSAYVQSFRSVDGVDDALASARHNRGVAPEIWGTLPRRTKGAIAHRIARDSDRSNKQRAVGSPPDLRAPRARKPCPGIRPCRSRRRR
jgi:hypothetical protein